MTFDRYSRRQFLMHGSAALAAAAAAVGPRRYGRAQAVHAHAQPTVPGFGAVFRSPTLTPFVDALPILPKRALGGEVQIAQALHRFHRDLAPAPSWGFAGQSHMGPIFVANRSEHTEVTFVNALPRHVFADDIDLSHHGTSPDDLARPPLSMHLHGAPNPPEHDGHPLHLFRPGERRSYVFNNELAATTLWLHDHAMGNTRLNLYAGLLTPYWVRDRFDTGRDDNPLGLPAGPFELPLIIQDKLFYDDGRQRYYATPTVPQNSWQGGFCGDVMCVNGKVWPDCSVARGLYRFRLVNGNSLSDLGLSLSNGMAFYVIGNDGGLLDAPVPVKRLLVGVGERYDVLVDFSGLLPGEQVELVNDEQIVWAGQMIGSFMIPKVMRFTATAERGFVGPLPTRLRGGRGQPHRLPALATPTRVRRITLNLLFNEPKVPFSDMNINNMGYLDEPVEMPTPGSVERWDIINTSSMPHTLHIHLVQFRILDRQDFDAAGYSSGGLPPKGTRWAPEVEPFLASTPPEPPAPEEAGWKDTVHCWPDQVTRIVVRFPTEEELGFPFDEVFGTVRMRHADGTVMTMPLQGYSWHCHITDHEDHEMMLRFRLPPP